MDESVDQIIFRNAQFSTIDFGKDAHEKNGTSPDEFNLPAYASAADREFGAWDWRNALNEF
jgi:hypothetical protein